MPDKIPASDSIEAPVLVAFTERGYVLGWGNTLAELKQNAHMPDHHHVAQRDWSDVQAYYQEMSGCGPTVPFPGLVVSTRDTVLHVTRVTWDPLPDMPMRGEKVTVHYLDCEPPPRAWAVDLPVWREMTKDAEVVPFNRAHPKILAVDQIIDKETLVEADLAKELKLLVFRIYAEDWGPQEIEDAFLELMYEYNVIRRP